MNPPLCIAVPINLVLILAGCKRAEIKCEQILIIVFDFSVISVANNKREIIKDWEWLEQNLMEILGK